MADIVITVNLSTELITITLDKWEWTGLTVNGEPLEPYNGSNPNIQFQYVQKKAGMVKFTAAANQNINLVNGPNILPLQDGKKTCLALISYQEKPTSEVILVGTVFIHQGVLGDKQSPILFSQGRMTGTFKTVEA
jgi:hypothetical protein